jgi:hypothetical protein
MEPACNSDVVYQGFSYHVQTEDWGDVNPFVVTKVFRSGAVLLNVKTPYEKIEQNNFAAGRLAIRLGMREQHQKILDQLVSGTLVNHGLK